MVSADQGYDKATQLIRQCVTADGFLATTTGRNNYHRVWGRDGSIIGLAALLIGDDELVAACRHTLETLARHQGPHGEIPSNVDPVTDRVSYGGTAGRVDANLWFLICCGEYWQATGDDEFLANHIEVIERVRFLLGAWEFNNRGLLYIPITGDWADEYLQNGYVLYDQLLYLQAQRELAAIHQGLHGSSDHVLEERIARLKHLIRCNYWLTPDGDMPDDVYHPVLYKKGRTAEAHCDYRYYLSFFSPAGYGYRFDAFANVLVSLLGVANEGERAKIDRFIAEEVVQDEVMVLPAFHPVITPTDDDWEDLQMTFSYTFKNHPHEYHNGGLWPMVTGFRVADLAARGHTDLAQQYLDGIHRANAQPMQDHEWGFPEFLHGNDHTPGGTPRLGWSAAAAVIGQKACEGNIVFSQARGND